MGRLDGETHARAAMPRQDAALHSTKPCHGARGRTVRPAHNVISKGM